MPCAFRLDLHSSSCGRVIPWWQDYMAHYKTDRVIILKHSYFSCYSIDLNTPARLHACQWNYFSLYLRAVMSLQPTFD